VPRITLWEDTIVTALRDMQWLNIAASHYDADNLIEMLQVYPPVFLKLDGNAESKIGDVAMKQDERFFLIEVKSEEHAIRDEWQAGRRKDEEKALLARLKGLPSDDEAMFRLCLRGHLLTYWSGARKRPTDIWVPGQIWAEPYYLGCARLRRNCDVMQDVGLPFPDDDYLLEIEREAAQPRDLRSISEDLQRRLDTKTTTACSTRAGYQLAISATLLQVFSGKVRVGKRLESGHLWQPEALGLTRDEFEEYLRFLVPKGEEEPLHAVALTTHGSFYRIVTDTAHLGALIDGKLGPERRRTTEVMTHADEGDQSPSALKSSRRRHE
jgi:hypothetical protein